MECISNGQECNVTKRWADRGWVSAVCHWEKKKKTGKEEWRGEEEREKKRQQTTNRKQTNRKTHNNEHSPDCSDCITHQLSPRCLYSTLSGALAVQSFQAEVLSVQEVLGRGKKIEFVDPSECIHKKTCGVPWRGYRATWRVLKRSDGVEM